MRIAQIVLPDASAFEQKCQRIDAIGLAERHQVVNSLADADLAHVYGSNLPAAMFRAFPVEYVASAAPARTRFSLRPPRMPASLLSPATVPEAVEENYFVRPAAIESRQHDADARRRRAGVFGPHRPGVRNMIEQTRARIERFRDDIEWSVFEHPPSPEDLTGVDVWVDPVSKEDDYDGFVAEAIVAGKVVVAGRTKLNWQRLEKGRTGFLVPCNDPNEMVHAILAALFKLEVARTKIEAAGQTAGKFRPRQRIRALERIYETVVPTPS